MGTSKGYLPPTGHLWSDAKRAVSSMNEIIIVAVLLAKLSQVLPKQVVEPEARECGNRGIWFKSLKFC